MHQETTIRCVGQVTPPKTLNWTLEGLVDWAGGGSEYRLDGSFVRAKVYHSYCFDFAKVSPSERYVLICAKLHTAGQLMENGTCLRQINRDTYCANAYEYPALLAELRDGREVLIHCPQSYCRLDIEELTSGKCMTDTVDRKPEDFFHSRLSISPGKKWLMSAGWVWHPVDMIQINNIEAALSDPHQLDKALHCPPGNYEISSAAFIDDEYVVVSSSEEFLGDEEDPQDNQPGPSCIARWRIEGEYEQAFKLDRPAGELMPINKRFVVTMFEHPRLLDLEQGQVIYEWSHINSGKQKSSIIWHEELPPPTALDQENARFAIYCQESRLLHMVRIDRQALA